MKPNLSDRMDSNHLTPAPKANALPIVLLSVFFLYDNKKTLDAKPTSFFFRKTMYFYPMIKSKYVRTNKRMFCTFPEYK